MGVAETERLALCDLFAERGPDAPTLCGDWRTRDLAAHLALRDRRPDAAAGILVGPLAAYTERVQAGFAARPWDELVRLVRTGPPVWSPFALPVLAELVNSAEYLVHHEDVRRGGADWAPRPPEERRDAAAWAALGRVGRLAYRRSPVGVVLRRPDGAEHVARRGPDQVAVVGEPVELLLHAFGRSAVRVGHEGDERAVARVEGLDRSF